MKIILPAYLIVALLIGCNRTRQTKAKIFERKEINENKLMILYTYQIDKSNYTDSAVIDNVVIKDDSINVIINLSTPQKSIPDLKN